MPRPPAFVVLVAALVAGCAAAPPSPEPDTVAAADVACARLVEAFDAAVAGAGTDDGAYARVDGFRTLRIDRLLASYTNDPMDAARFGAWIAAMRALDRDARAVELANLPPAARERFDAQGLDACAERVLARDLAAPNARVWLIGSAVVPDDYRDTWRALGLYPITGLVLAAGVAIYERDARARFVEDAPSRGPVVAYGPPASTMTPEAIRRTVAALVTGDPLPPLPRAEPAAVDSLLAAYAPMLAIDTAGDADRPGRPHRRADGTPDVDTTTPVVYARLAWTRFDGALLPQLVYTAWFAHRAPAYAGDPFAGRLDGLVWRVTLDRDGAPLAFDTIHPCGCYHQFVPTARLAARVTDFTLEEGALVVRTLPELAVGTRVRLDVASRTHYLRGVTPLAAGAEAATESVTYTIERDDALRTAKLFGPNGVVAGTERAERFALWISGIESAGAMRQWGRQPTAFVGRRHFDEAFLFERYFTRHAR